MNKYRLTALAMFFPALVFGAVIISIPEGAQWISYGTIQSAHEDIDCSGCHAKSPGTTRQQVQSKVGHALGWRETDVDFGYAAVESKACLACHTRPNERHPIYRFREPRFEEAIAQVNATSCLGCHAEHTGQRAFIEPGVCAACHEDLKMKNDPLDISHVTLIADKNWDSCLGCHDFHGNHKRLVPTTVRRTYPVEVLRAYLADGANPYGEKIHPAKTVVENVR